MKWAISVMTLAFLFSNAILEDFPCLLLFVCGICINVDREIKFHLLEFTYYDLLDFCVRSHQYM